mgnify:CR=1 FL=1
MKEGDSNRSTPTLAIVEFVILVISFVLLLIAQTNDGYGMIIVFSFLIYLTLAVYRLVYQFSLSIMSGINLSVITVFLLSLIFWSVTEGDFWRDGADVTILILILMTPLVLLAALQEKFKDSPGWKKFVVGLFCSLPFSLLSVVVSLGIVIGFIEGNMDNF